MKMNRKWRARDASSGSGIFFSSARKSKASVSGRGEGEGERQAGVRCLCFWGAFSCPPKNRAALSFLWAPHSLSPRLGQNDNVTRSRDVS